MVRGFLQEDREEGSGVHAAATCGRHERGAARCRGDGRVPGPGGGLLHQVSDGERFFYLPVGTGTVPVLTTNAQCLPYYA